VKFINFFPFSRSLSGDFTKRVVVSLSIVIFVFVLTVALAMLDTFSWTGVFFYVTIGCVILLNAANAVYQNTVFGTAAKLPPKYMGFVILGTVQFVTHPIMRSSRVTRQVRFSSH
jgi:equilibrative nucleoside transporter 1/2/3